MPGLINTHHHFYQTLTRAFPPALDSELFPWLQALYPVWQRLTPDALRAAAQLAFAELLLSGCTTTTDHHYVFPAGLDQAIDIEVEEARRLGIRVVLTRGSMNLSVEDGGLPPKGVVQREDRILADSERLIRAYHQPGPGAMVQIALAPCSPFSVTRSLMADTASLARRHDVRLHTHLAETRDETAFCEARFGCRPLDYLESAGWLDERVWLAHGIYFDDAELPRLARAGVSITHCPASNMVLASGFCRVPDLEGAGCAVGLGVDGSASNDASNLIEEVRHAFLCSGSRTASSGSAISTPCAGRPRVRRPVSAAPISADRGGQAGRSRAVQVGRASLFRLRRPARRPGAVRRAPGRPGDGRRALGGDRRRRAGARPRRPAPAASGGGPPASGTLRTGFTDV